MQRTFQSKYFQRPEVTGLKVHRRGSSLNTRTPIEVLELIRLRKSRLTTHNESYSTKNHNSRELELLLPRIETLKKYQFQDQEYQERGKRHTNNPSGLQSEESSKRHRTVEIHRKREEGSQRERDVEEEKLKRGIERIRMILKKQYMNVRDKSVEYILPLVDYLEGQNVLFKSLPKMMIFSIVSRSRIRFYEPEAWVYRKSELLSSFYIILCGKLRIICTQSDFRKVSVTGETLSQHILFMEWNPKHHRNEGAKCISDCFLLEIDYNTYLKLSKDLILQGYKSEFLVFENTIKKYYQEKKAMKEGE